MTPKEKAKIILDDLCYEVEFDSDFSVWEQAKTTGKYICDQVVLVLIGEHTETLKSQPSINYWQEVKQEIEKL